MEEALQKAGLEVHCALIPDGEEYKNMEETMQVVDRALQLQLTGSSVVVALGGGVVGDGLGCRGHLPAGYFGGPNSYRTLLAQVDSSVGGKVE